MQSDTSVTMIDTSLIIPNKYQPRKVFDENALNTLAESIKHYGIINPILVRKKEDKYEIIAGERRFRAAQKVGLNQIPVIVKNADEQEMAELALIENIQRQELSPIEEAKSYEEIMRIGNQTQESLAKKLGKSQGSIANKIRLLSLPEEIQDALAHKKISERHARSLINIGNKEKQIELLNRIMEEKLTVKETEEIINHEEKEIDEDEIKQAISDIMKSLNIKEEEKEDDNMNNGNFFPNFDNNNAVNNNTSLNMMNMQSMNQPPMEPAPEVVMPTTNPQMNESIQMPLPTSDVSISQPMTEMPTNQMAAALDTNMNNNFNPMGGFMDQPENNLMQPNMPTADQPIIGQMSPVQQQTIEPQVAPLINDAPLFGNQNPVNPEPAPQQMDMSTPMIDVPLFNPNVVMPTAEQTTMEPTIPVQQPVLEPQVETLVPEASTSMTPNSFEIPVVNGGSEMTPVPEETQPTQDKLTQLQEYLTANGYTFKTFNNDTENCVIIELPRN